MLKTHKSLRDSYAEKLRNGEKEYKPMKKTQLKAKTGLTAKTRLTAKTKLTAKNTTQPAKKQKQFNREAYFSIFSKDLKRCFITGDTKDVHIHHIFGAANKENSEKYGFLVPLRSDWHNMSDYGVHFNKELDLKLKRKCQEYWLDNYGSQEGFISVFGKWW